MKPMDEANRQKLSAVGLVCSLLRSTAAAWATAWLPAVAPPRMRPSSRRATTLKAKAAPIITKLAATPARQISRTRRLPLRSEISPSTGAM